MAGAMIAIGVIGLVVAAAGTTTSLVMADIAADKQAKTVSEQKNQMNDQTARNQKAARDNMRQMALQAGRSTLELIKSQRGVRRARQESVASSTGNNTVNLGNRPLGKPVIV